MSKRNKYQSGYTASSQNDQEEPVSEMTEEQASILTALAQMTGEVEEDSVLEPVEPTPEIQTEVTKEEATRNIEPIVLKQAPEPVSVITSSDVVIKAAHADVNAFIQTVVGFLDNYVTVMAPRAIITPKDGARHQFNLYNVLTQIINQTNYNIFKGAFMTLMAYMKKHSNGVFGDKNITRFAEEWPGSSDKLKHNQALLNLLLILANDKERPVNKYVNLESVFNTGFTEAAKENLTRFMNNR